MKRIISVFCIVMMLAAALSLTACGSDENKIDGTYLLVEMNAGGEDMSAVLDSLDIYLTIEGDTAVIDMAGETITWTVDTENQLMRNEDGSEAPYRIEDNRLIIENVENGATNRMTFEKQASTPDSK